jgi:hypothetical protein
MECLEEASKFVKQNISTMSPELDKLVIEFASSLFIGTTIKLSIQEAVAELKKSLQVPGKL